MTAPLRDPETGALNFAVSIDVHLLDQLMPVVVDCRNWKAARAYLASAEFRRLGNRVDFVTMHNRASTMDGGA